MVRQLWRVRSVTDQSQSYIRLCDDNRITAGWISVKLRTKSQSLPDIKESVSVTEKS